MTNVIQELAYLHGEPQTFATLKAQPEHFFVSEKLSFNPSGSGEHFLVRIRKKGENTKYVANELAKACGVTSRDVSWAGLKDRHAITEQWFSVHLAGKSDPDLTEFVASHEGIEAVLDTARHNQKLRPGDLIGNDFSLVVTDIQGDKQDIEARLNAIKQQGVPNYFGNQRFGNEGNNLVEARKWGEKKYRLKDRSQRSFYLSAARAHLFNLVLSARIEHSLLAPMLGDLLIDTKDKLQLVTDLAAAALQLEQGFQVSGPMTGDNELPTSLQAQEFEQNIVNAEPFLLAIIRDNRMQHERRALIVYPDALQFAWEGANLRINFGLPAGAFATALMREVIKEQPSAHIDK